MEGRVLNPAAILILLVVIIFLICLFKSLKGAGVLCKILTIVIVIAAVVIFLLI